MTPAVRREAAFLLVILQAGIGLLTALGATAWALAGFTGNFVLVALQLGWVVALVWLGTRVLRGGRRAAWWLVGMEAGLALVGLLALVTRLGVGANLGPIATNLVIPGLVMALAGSLAVSPGKGPISSARRRPGSAPLRPPRRRGRRGWSRPIGHA